jgi:hypothetical protein
MSVRDLIADLIGGDSPNVRHDSPNVRQAETRATSEDSPDSPLSPVGGEEKRIRAYRWIVQVADGDPCEVWLSPPGTAAEAMQRIEGAVTADPDKWLTVGCATCRHLRRPGLADGYCIKRADLAPAYGPSHPLRQLPADRGQSCADWEMDE